MALDLFDYPVDFLVDEWAEQLADHILERLNRQKDPLLQRRLLSVQLKMLRAQTMKELVDRLGDENND